MAISQITPCIIIYLGVPSDLVITARSKDALEETKQLIKSQAPGIGVHVVAGDMGDVASLPSLCTLLLESIDTSKHKLGLLVNNAGTMNSFDIPFLSWNDPVQIQDYMAINFTSMMVLTTRFLSAFPPSGKRYIINMSSILATLFFPRFSLYSTGKAARNAFMGILGAEMPDVRQFSYGPGPCDTDMYRGLPKECAGAVPLTPKESMEKLIRLLKEDKFENGSVIDYFDDEKLFTEHVFGGIV